MSGDRENYQLHKVLIERTLLAVTVAPFQEIQWIEHCVYAPNNYQKDGGF